MGQSYAARFYNSQAWKRTQAAYMASQNFLCERCGNLARIVHHKKHITPQNIHDITVTLDWKNLEALCIDCHNAEHMGGAVIGEGLRFDSDGNIVPVQR